MPDIILADESRLQAYAERSIAEKTMTGQSYSGSEEPQLEVAGSSALIQVVGGLTYRDDFWSWIFGGCSYQGICALIEKAEVSSMVEQVVIRFDTPGGTVQGIEEAAEAIANCKKPTVAVVDPECASAGLWLASQCNEIVCCRSGFIGSLGVQLVHKSNFRMLKEAGIDVKIFRADISPDKNLGHPNEEMSDRVKADYQERCDKWGARFVAAVAKGRDCTTEHVLSKFGQGKMLEASEALSAGLVDRIGSLSEVLMPKKSTGTTSRNRTSRTAV